MQFEKKKLSHINKSKHHFRQSKYVYKYIFFENRPGNLTDKPNTNKKMEISKLPNDLFEDSDIDRSRNKDAKKQIIIFNKKLTINSTVTEI